MLVMIRLDPDKEIKVIEMAKSGIRPAEISNSVELPTHYVRKLIHKHGVKIVAQNKSDNVDIYRIIAMLINGESLTRIGEQFGVTRQYIYLIKEKCLKAGIKLDK